MVWSMDQYIQPSGQVDLQSMSSHIHTEVFSQVVG